MNQRNRLCLCLRLLGNGYQLTAQRWQLKLEDPGTHCYFH